MKGETITKLTVGKTLGSLFQVKQKKMQPFCENSYLAAHFCTVFFLLENRRLDLIINY